MGRTTRFPRPLTAGDRVRVVAPSRSLGILSPETCEIATATLAGLGLQVDYGTHAREMDAFASTSIAVRVADLHDAFRDPNVAGILTAIGGYNANELLDHLDFELIARNPKTFCGYSDITILTSAIFQETGLATFYGPHFSSFGMKLGNEHTVEHFRRACLSREPFHLEAAARWSDDAWYLDQDERQFRPNPGPRVLRPGRASGTLVGGHLGTLGLLQGTDWFPTVEDPVLFVEEDEGAAEEFPFEFLRDLHSLLQQPALRNLRALLIGRLHSSTKLIDGTEEHMLETLRLASDVPVILGLDVGHTMPLSTLPLGAQVDVDATRAAPALRIRFE